MTQRTKVFKNQRNNQRKNLIENQGRFYRTIDSKRRKKEKAPGIKRFGKFCAEMRVDESVTLYK